MRIIIFYGLIFFNFYIHAQSMKIEIDWDGEEEYFINKKSLIVPKSKNFNSNYAHGEYFTLVKQWQEDLVIDKNSVVITNLESSRIDINNFSGLKNIKFSDDLNLRFNTSSSKNQLFSFLDFSPIIIQNGEYIK